MKDNLYFNVHIYIYCPFVLQVKIHNICSCFFHVVPQWKWPTLLYTADFEERKNWKEKQCVCVCVQKHSSKLWWEPSGCGLISHTTRLCGLLVWHARQTVIQWCGFNLRSRQGEGTSLLPSQHFCRPIDVCLAFMCTAHTNIPCPHFDEEPQ